MRHVDQIAATLISKLRIRNHISFLNSSMWAIYRLLATLKWVWVAEVKFEPDKRRWVCKNWRYLDGFSEQISDSSMMNYFESCLLYSYLCLGDNSYKLNIKTKLNKASDRLTLVPWWKLFRTAVRTHNLDIPIFYYNTIAFL